jgi:starch synthase (maltosyl-transferring)
MFPRSAGDGTRHGTFADVEAMLPYVVDMGFDILYLPPIHPIGTTKRKGRNNALVASAGEPGSPWAIGSSSGGHKSIHPELGSEADLRRLIEAARHHRIEIALDIAFRTAPSASRRIRPRSTRTSIRSTSSRRTGRRCGRSS